MCYKIAMLLKPALIDYCKEQMKEPPRGVELTYIPYTEAKEFEKVSYDICENFDGVITSGSWPDSILERLEWTKTMCKSYFDFDIENTYRLILSELLLHPGLSIEQIGIDVLGSRWTLGEVILEDRMHSLVDDMERDKKSVDSYEDMELEEQRMTDEYLMLFKEGRIRSVLTSSLYVADALNAKGCSCSYIFPSLNMMNYVIGNVCHAIDLKRARGGSPAVIRIDLHLDAEENTYEKAQRVISLKKSLSDFVQRECGRLTLKSGNEYFEIYTVQEELARLTNRYTNCPLTEFLDEIEREAVSIGYGVGADFYQARSNSVNASSYAHSCRDKTATSFLLDEENRLTELSSGHEVMPWDKTGIPQEYINEVAYQVKLSSATLMKIINTLRAEGTNEISSTELISRLGVSLRTANHYLANLKNNGKAEIIGKKRPNGKGPNISIYKIDLPF